MLQEKQRKVAKRATGENKKPESPNVLDMRLKSDFLDNKKSITAEIPNIRLRPEQIEEIQLCDYSLRLFYATRIQPLSLGEIKEYFPEPESQKAQSVINRFLAVGLIHVTPEEKYYSNFPENYVNYSDYRYDKLLEARKDKKVFNLMKEFTGNREYWKDKTYFSMDAFYTDEQTKEVQAMFKEIKEKLKQYSNDNAKTKSVKGMKFRRIKFFDMFFAILLAFVLVSMPSTPSFAEEQSALTDVQLRDLAVYRGAAGKFSVVLESGGGNDPTILMVQRAVSPEEYEHMMGHTRVFTDIMANSGLTMPLAFAVNTLSDSTNIGTDLGPILKGGSDDSKLHDGSLEDSGGGHDPTVIPDKIPCILEDEDGAIEVKLRELCPYQKLLINYARCKSEKQDCSKIEALMKELVDQNPSLLDK